MRGHWLASIRELSPAAFASVMATAIVSTSIERYGLHLASLVLAAVAGVLYVALTAVWATRVWCFPAEVASDWTQPRRAFGFLTFVAGSAVLGERLEEAGLAAAGAALVAIALATWVVLGYGVALSVIVSRSKAAAVRSVDGGWMLWVVATESVATAAAMIAVHQPPLLTVMAVVAATAWAAGCLLYLVLIAILLARLLLFDVEPDDVDPNYWVAMGATAITVLAGARLLELPRGVALVSVLVPTVTGIAFIFWAFGTWLVPLLAGLGFWRHVLRRTRLSYTPGFWTIVFPLGMYSTASAELAAAVRLPLMHELGGAAAGAAVIAWVLVAAGATVNAGRRIPWRPASNVSRRKAVAPPFPD